MLRIRLARTGKKKQAHYRIVVADKERAVTAKYIEILGTYNPHTKELKIDSEKAAEWMGKGAKPTNTVAVLFKKNNIKLPKWVKIEEKNKKPKKEEDKSAAKEQGVASKDKENQPAVDQPDSIEASTDKSEAESSEVKEEDKEGSKSEVKEAPVEEPGNEKKEAKEKKPKEKVEQETTEDVDKKE